MPIRAYLGNASFTAEVVTVMTTAFDRALNALEIIDLTDPLAEIVARKIIEIARYGEHDPERMAALAVESIRQ